MVKQLAEITSIRLFFCMYVTYKTDYLKNLVKKRKKNQRTYSSSKSDIKPIFIPLYNMSVVIISAYNVT